MQPDSLIEKAPRIAAHSTASLTAAISESAQRAKSESATERIRQGDLLRRRTGAMAMAVVGLLALSQRRMGYDSPVVMAIEAILISLIILLAWLFMLRFPRHPAVDDSKRRSLPRVSMLLVGLAVLFPWLFDFVARGFGYGNAYEILMLSCLAWGAFAAAVMARLPKTTGLSVICSGFLTLFTTFISDSAWGTWFAYLWIAICLWWLVANHWESVELLESNSVQSMHRVGLGYLVLGVLAFVACTLAVSGRVPVLHKLQGEWAPTSGGTSWNDSAARSGVGSGDLLIAAKDHASSFGAVETDFFLDSDKPSLFDVFSDEFGEPKQKFRVERAQALSPQETRSEEGKFAETNRSTSGGEFSTDRERPKLAETPRDLASDALMFWEGQGGVRLAVERYSQFDGVVWRQPDAVAFNDVVANVASVPQAEEVEGRTWFLPPSQYQRYRDGEYQLYVDSIPEALKFTRFRSPVIPTRMGTQLWSIDQITLADLFAYRADDTLLMPGRLHVPDYTMVRFINSRIDIECVERLLEGPLPSRPTLALPPRCTASIEQLKEQYILGKRQGWPQISAIVHGLRRDFRLTRHSQATPNAQGSVAKWSSEQQLGPGVEEYTPLEQFLESKQGPSYLFATAAAMLLESAGYQTRLVSGFYVNPRHYLRGDNEYAIKASDAHVWLEVAVGPGGWVPLEPTPGYRLPPYKAGLWYRLRQAQGAIFTWSAVAMATTCLLLLFRTILLDLVCWGIAPLFSLVSDRQRIVWLGRLLDLRLRWSGYGRPLNRVPRDHFKPLLNRLPNKLAEHLQNFLEVSDAVCFGGAKELSVQQRYLVRRVWNELSCYRLRRATSGLKQATVE